MFLSLYFYLGRLNKGIIRVWREGRGNEHDTAGEFYDGSGGSCLIFELTHTLPLVPLPNRGGCDGRPRGEIEGVETERRRASGCGEETEARLW